jgi:glycosyltransferase involved in cell wall biosynthesis
VARSNAPDVADGDTSPSPRPARIRVATLLSSPPRPGTGIGTFILGLTEALERNPELELVLIAPSSDRGHAGRPGSQLLLAIHQLKELRRVRPDVIHTHDHPALLAAAVAYRRLSGGHARVLYTSHFDPVDKRSLLRRLLLGWLLSSCEAVTVVAEDSVAKLALMATPTPKRSVIRVVPGAATVRIRDKRDPAVVAFSASIGHDGGPLLLQVSNFIFPAKVEGAFRLLEALALVRRRIPDVRLILVGTGPLVDRVKQTRDQLGLGAAVTIPGTFIEDLSLPVGLSDVHCHITLQDACPISILEAMHAGKAVVASRTGGIPEIIEDGVNGKLVDNDPERIASVIIDLLEDSDKALAMGVRAQQIARVRFTWERVAADFETLYGATPRRLPATQPAEVHVVD